MFLQAVVDHSIILLMCALASLEMLMMAVLGLIPCI